MEKMNKKYLAFGGTIAATLLLGAYTQSVSWLPELRTLAHFCGATVVPGFSSFFVSNLILDYEQRKNKKIEKLKRKDKDSIKEDEQQIDKYQINPKTKDILLKASTVIGSLGYIAFCASWESWQFAQTNILQLPQYIADTVGPLVGMLTIGTIDCKPLYDKIDRVSDKIRKKFSRNKEKSTETVQEQTIEKEQNLHEKSAPIEQNIDKETLPPWDLRLYSQNNELENPEKNNSTIQNNKNKEEDCSLDR